MVQLIRTSQTQEICESSTTRRRQLDGILFFLMLCWGSSHLAAEPPGKPQAPQKHYDAVFYFNYLKNINKDEDNTKNLTITDQNAAKDYLVSGGEFDGYNIFKLFKAKSDDFILEQRSGCGPECEQNAFHVLVFKDGVFSRKVAFDSIYPKQQVDRIIKQKIASLNTKLKTTKWQPWFQISRDDASIRILLLENRPGSDVKRTRMVDVAKMVWKGFKFQLETVDLSKPTFVDLDAIR